MAELNTLNNEWVLTWLRRSAEVVARHKSELSELDRLIGDGDHGENLDRGFSAVLAKLDAEPPATPGDALKLVAMTLMSKVGGAAGPLYGTAYLRAATAVGGTLELDAPLLAVMLTAARDGLVARGKAEPRDKTMVDAWTPAVDAAAASVAAGAHPTEVLAAAAAAAEQGAEDTIPLVAHKGRASYLGERSAGHKDPGAASSALLLRAAADTAAGYGAQEAQQ